MKTRTQLGKQTSSNHVPPFGSDQEKIRAQSLQKSNMVRRAPHQCEWMKNRFCRCRMRTLLDASIRKFRVGTGGSFLHPHNFLNHCRFSDRQGSRIKLEWMKKEREYVKIVRNAVRIVVDTEDFSPNIKRYGLSILNSTALSFVYNPAVPAYLRSAELCSQLNYIKEIVGDRFRTGNFTAFSDWTVPKCEGSLYQIERGGFPILEQQHSSVIRFTG